ncbi:RES family NAD+ phosphorylase [Solirhodobacter olei]|uniref:RES family NAD+ phosphorylase n=1 Tax=Solirhodobacter olei TaxID=2493082 RepID=UPI001F4D7FFF|nr:RES family NAD+ phosphorylase [Solirhodobacter olei]
MAADLPPRHVALSTDRSIDDIADPHDWKLIAAAVQRTNPRLAETYGALDTIPIERRLSGEGASWVMAAFVHFSPDRPSRFSDGSYGVYYAGDSLETALREHSFHVARFYAATAEPAGWVSEVRELVGSIDANMVDLRENGSAASYLEPDPARYAPAQGFAAELRSEGADGIVYPSVRHPEGTCIAAFWPNVVSVATQADHYRYHWNGHAIDFVRRTTGDRAIFEFTERGGDPSE